MWIHPSVVNYFISIVSIIESKYSSQLKTICLEYDASEIYMHAYESGRETKNAELNKIPQNLPTLLQQLLISSLSIH